jgi:putative ABC transport system substrate-binding protein
MKSIGQSARMASIGHLLNRRRSILAIGSALVVYGLPARAQPGPIRRVGFLSGGTQSDAANFLKSFLDGLRELGYREGQNLTLDARFADYSAEQAIKLAAEIAALKPAVIVASGSGIAPACRLSPPIPVVFLHSGDPVVAGFADSLARPGRNATGISLLALDLIVKRMEFLKQIHPKLRRVAFLASPEHAGQQYELAASRAAAERLGVEGTYHQARNPAELATALTAVAAERPDAALLFSDALMVGQRQALAAFFLKHRIPSAAGWAAFPESGHLLSYGPERHAAWRRLAYFVDRIIKGARPGDLPIELPTVVELVVNRRTAAAMDLVLPPAILARADRVVDSPAAM